MKPGEPALRARVGVLAREPWVAAGLVAGLGSGTAVGGWDLQTQDAPAPADAYLLHEPVPADWLRLPAVAPVVALGGTAPPSHDMRPLALLASGSEAPRVAAALAATLLGLSVIDPARPRALAPSPDALAADAEPLTEREVQVLELIAKGMTNRDIGGLLGISAHTAKFHVAQLLAKLGAASRAEAVSSALRLGLIGV